MPAATRHLPYQMSDVVITRRHPLGRSDPGTWRSSHQQRTPNAGRGGGRAADRDATGSSHREPPAFSGHVGPTCREAGKGEISGLSGGGRGGSPTFTSAPSSISPRVMEPAGWGWLVRGWEAIQSESESRPLDFSRGAPCAWPPVGVCPFLLTAAHAPVPAVFDRSVAHLRTLPLPAQRCSHVSSLPLGTLVRV